jgi:Na+/glutamate symporter
MPVFGVKPMFASILPVGFAGGHGTAGGLTETYKKVCLVLVLYGTICMERDEIWE